MDASRPPAIFTTSWDDGHPLDLRVAELLARYDCRGTFYVPLEYAGFPRLTPSELRTLDSAGMEIGSHTVTHPRFTGLSSAEARRELEDSRDGLEQILGTRVRSFCFPEGKFSLRHSSLLSDAGYELARTTVAFRMELAFHPYAMPVTFQFWPHTRQVIIRHALREGNFAGLLNWLRRWGGRTDIPELSTRVMDYIEEFGGTLHIWGHSWEVESRELWPALERTLAACSGRPGVHYTTNIGVLDLTSGLQPVRAVALNA